MGPTLPTFYNDHTDHDIHALTDHFNFFHNIVFFFPTKVQYGTVPYRNTSLEYGNTITLRRKLFKRQEWAQGNMTLDKEKNDLTS